MTDMTLLEDANTSLRAHSESAWRILKDPVKKIDVGVQIRNHQDLQAVVEDKGGWASFLSIAEKAYSKKTSKPGSKNDVYLKIIKNYVKDLESKKKDVDRLISMNNCDCLEPNQARAIELIRMGTSVLIMGPPGSGKTHCTLYTLDVHAMKNAKEIAIYVAPTSELVLQAFSNLSETFPTLSIGLVCPLMFHVEKPNIIVGTPQELWVFLSQSKYVWNKAIIDEVHTISEETLGYADSVRYLLCGLRMASPRTLVALSATVHPEDVRVLTDYLKECTRIQTLETIVLEPSPIPIRRYHVGEAGRFCVDPPPNEVPLTPKLLFRVFKTLGSDGTLLFAYDDMQTWKLFTETLQWLETMNEVYYSSLIDISEEVNRLLQEADGCAQEVYRLENIQSAKARKEGRLQELQDVRLTNQARDKVLDVLHREWTRFQKLDELPEFYEVATEEDCRIANTVKLSGLEVGQPVPLVVKTILRDILAYSFSNNNKIPFVSAVGPYFSLLNTKRPIEDREFESFCHMCVSMDANGKEVVRIQGENESEWSAINGLVRLAQAEEITIASVKPTIKLMVKAFRFGMALMMPSLPFVVTQTIRKLLNERKIPVIFATQDLAVGISYPLRNVVIVGREIGSSLRIQMAGRVGRRGFDKDGRVVFLNGPSDESAQADRLVIHPPAEEIGTLDATCCSVVQASRLFSRLSHASLFEALSIIFPEMRTATNDKSVSTILRLADGTIKTMETKDIACEVLRDIRSFLSVCMHIHWCAHSDNQDDLSQKVRSLTKLTRVANQNVIRFCF